MLEADLILHVRDISHPETAEQAADVADILTSLGVNKAVPMFEVWNKLDLVDAQPARGLAGAGHQSRRGVPGFGADGRGRGDAAGCGLDRV